MFCKENYLKNKNKSLNHPSYPFLSETMRAAACLFSAVKAAVFKINDPFNRQNFRQFEQEGLKALNCSPE